MAVDENGNYIPKSQEFERDINSTNLNDRIDRVSFADDANVNFVYSSMEDLLDETKDLGEMLKVFMTSQKERLEILEGYSNGKNYTILNGRRRLERGKADYRISHNWGGYISTFLTGHIVGKPVGVTYSGDEEDLSEEELENITDNNDLDSLNYELAYDASRYGRAFAYHYRDKDNIDRIVMIDPKDMFAIHSYNVSNELIGAVHCPVFNNKVHVTVYTDDEIITFKPLDVGQYNLQEDYRTEHSYGIVPIEEWTSDRYRIGDFETVLSNIDAYDAAQSDTANYMSDLNDATLVINVDNLDRLGGEDGIQSMTDANVILLENGLTPDGKVTQGSAGYIYKQYDVAGTEAYKTRLIKDIFKQTNTPDMTDENFGTSSGVAIEYKLINLKQVQVTKQNYFTKALRRRYQLIENAHKELNEGEVNANLLKFTFHPNLPQDIWAEIEQFVNAGGELSQETLRELASFTDNAQELERLANEGITPSMTDLDKAMRGVSSDQPHSDEGITE